MVTTYDHIVHHCPMFVCENVCVGVWVLLWEAVDLGWDLVESYWVSVSSSSNALTVLMNYAI